MPLTRITIPPLVLAGLMVAAPVLAAAETPRAILYYEAVVGTTSVGTPPCPEARAQLLPPGAKACTVVVQGRDSVDSVTGVGPVGGKFSRSLDEMRPAKAR